MLNSTVRQTAVTVAIAVCLAAAAWFQSVASSRWQDSARSEAVWSALVLEQIRHVYENEAPFALDVAQRQQRAAALAESAGDDGMGTLVTAQRFVEDQTARATRDSSTSPLLGDDYRTATGFDVQRRLADLIAADPGPTSAEAVEKVRQGDTAARTSEIFAAGTAVAVLLFLGGEIVATGRARRVSSGATPDVDLVPRPWTTAAHHRAVAVVALGAWLSVSLLPVLQVKAANSSASADAGADRLASAVTSSAIGAAAVQTFRATAERELSLRYDIELASQRTATDPDLFPDFPAELGQELRVLTESEASAVDDVTAVTDAMTADPGEDAGLGRQLSALLASDGRALGAAAEERMLLLERSESAGVHADLLQLALLLSTLTLTAVAVGRVGRSTWTKEIGPAVLLAGSVTAAGLSFIV